MAIDSRLRTFLAERFGHYMAALPQEVRDRLVVNLVAAWAHLELGEDEREVAIGLQWLEKCGVAAQQRSTLAEAWARRLRERFADEGLFLDEAVRDMRDALGAIKRKN